MATSLAPLPKALKMKAMVVRARIQSYLPVARGIMVDALVASGRQKFWSEWLKKRKTRKEKVLII